MRSFSAIVCIVISIILFGNLVLPRAYAASLSLEPQFKKSNIQEPMVIYLVVDVAKNSFVGFDASMLFDRSYYTLEKVQSRSDSIEIIYKKTSGNTGKAVITGLVPLTKKPLTGKINVASLTFRPLRIGQSQIKLIERESTIADSKSATNILTSVEGGSYEVYDKHASQNILGVTDNPKQVGKIIEGNRNYAVPIIVSIVCCIVFVLLLYLTRRRL